MGTFITPILATLAVCTIVLGSKTVSTIQNRKIVTVDSTNYPVCFSSVSQLKEIKIIQFPTFQPPQLSPTFLT